MSQYKPPTKKSWPPKQSQFILAIDSSFFDNNPLGAFKTPGITSFPADKFYAEALGRVLVRRRYEMDLADTTLPYRQFLPYDVLTKTGRDFQRRFFAYQRTPEAGEEELHGMVSIGLGGHVDARNVKWEGDVPNLATTVYESATCERLEEYKITDKGVAIPTEHMRHYLEKIFPQNNPTVNVLVDNTTNVDRRHFALVNFGVVPEMLEIECAESELITLGFLTYDELTAKNANGTPKYRLESWTKVCLEHFRTNAVKPPRPIGIAGEGLALHEQKPQDGSRI